MSNFTATSKSRPCVLCEDSSGDCRTNKTTGIIHCRHTSPISFHPQHKHVGRDKIGCEMFIDLAAPPPRRPSPSAEIKSHVDSRGAADRAAKPDADAAADRAAQAASAAAYSAKLFAKVGMRRELLSDAEVNWWSHTLHLPVSALTDYPLFGFDHPSRGRVLTYDTLHGDGTPAGRKFRTLDGTKISCQSPGLIYIVDDTSPASPLYASTCQKHAGATPILVVEGYTDAASCWSMGIAAIARDFNTHGADELITFCEHHHIDPARLVIMGENDLKQNGSWPGRDGAMSVASRISAHFHVPIRIAFPPPGIKDMRDWHHDAWVTNAPPWVTSDKWYEIDPSWGVTKSVLDYVALIAERVVEVAYDTTERDQARAREAQAHGHEDGAADAAALGLDQGPCHCDHDHNADAGDDTSASTDRAANRYANSARHFCPSATRIVFDHLESGKVMALWTPCRRLRCEVCGAICRALYKETIRVRLNAHWHDNPDAIIYKYPCGAGRQWVNVSSNIRHKDGSFMRIRGRFDDVVVASVPPPAGTANVQQITRRDAEALINELCAMIDDAPDFAYRMFFSSHKWKILTDPKSAPKGWRRRAEFTGDDDMVFGVANYHCKQSKRFQTSGRWWGYTGRIIFVGTTGADAEHIVEDIRTGEGSPVVDIRWGKRRTGNADADDQAAATNSTSAAPSPSTTAAGTAYHMAI